MKTIHKYPLTATQASVATHEHAQFVHVAEQHGQITLWAEVNPLERERTRKVRVVPTGGDVPLPLEFDYLGTVLLDAGALVFHVYVEWEETR